MPKNILVGVTSSIAAYKSVQLVSDLIKLGYDVDVIMTKNATEFIQPLTFSSLTKHKTYVDTFDRTVDWNIEHISLAKKADVFIIAPASANTIAKVTHGICDDLLTTTFLAATCPKLIAPAMNTNMLNNPVTQANIQRGRELGFNYIESESGLLACGDVGAGKLASIDIMIEAIEEALSKDKFLSGKRVLISGGPTVESLDPVRFLSNHSSGKMGVALARAARNAGAHVTYITGPVTLADPYHVETEHVETAQAMDERMHYHFENADIVIMAAAVADYRFKEIASEKIKKNDQTLTLEMIKNKDILASLGEKKTHQVLCGFAMETEHVLENAHEKRTRKNCDLLVVNDLRETGAGFKGDTNRVTLLSDQNTKELPLMSKDEVAFEILKYIAEEHIC